MSVFRRGQPATTACTAALPQRAKQRATAEAAIRIESRIDREARNRSRGAARVPIDTGDIGV
ncbi:hypothetical protein DB771_00940 [Burkholderia sp. AU29985]|nr:hypothetical protein XM57_10195 [Burkholderia cepacia]AYZ98037.1 hypothetical protein EGY28_24210 [Burkholderia dolosa]ETP66818.1 hypothetical protein BDSB_06870 [Burkholderia dolosa PC543]PRE48881.1 hypothetical protein C6P87_15370 [Burkholderia sp. AU12872]PUA78733.1 hypothetical protein DB771_00940 [Burkholderia sp. AU29985]